MARAYIKKRGRPSKSGKTVSPSPVSLPPSVDMPVAAASVIPDSGSTEPDLSSPATLTPKTAKPFWQVAEGSVQHQQVMRMLAMRLTGLTDTEIAEQLGLRPQTLHNYLYNVGKSGLISKEFSNARDQLEYTLVPKALREIDKALDDHVRHSTSGMTVAAQMAIRVAEGTVMKDFDRVSDGAVTTAIAINVVMPPGPLQIIREGAIGGIPNDFIEGDATDVRT